MGNYCVNRSNQVWNITRSNGGTDVIGKLYPNEIFAWVGGWEGNHSGTDYQRIYFRNSEGVPTHGWLAGPSGTGCLTLLPEVCYKEVIWKGNTYYAFKLRRAEKYYSANGGMMGTLPEGYIILTDRDAACGQSNPGLMNIYAFEAEEGIYVDVGSAFINAGLDKGSTMGKDCSFIGAIG